MKRKSKIQGILRKRNRISEAEQPLRQVTFRELLALNKPDWPLVLVGVVASALIGTFFPVMAPLFSELLRVSV